MVNSKSSVPLILLSVRSCTIHRVWHTICQCMFGSPPPYVRTTNCSICPVLLSVRLYTIHRVRCTICQRMSGGLPLYIRTTNSNVCPVFPRTSTQKTRAYVRWSQRTSALKDKRIHPPTLEYVWSKSLILPKCPYS